MSDKTTVQLLLEERFQQLAKSRKENNEMPAELREEVFSTLASIRDLEEKNEEEKEDNPHGGPPILEEE